MYNPETEAVFPPLPHIILKKIFFCLFLAVLGLRCCAWGFSSCSNGGLLSSCGVWASHCVGFSCCRAWALDVQILVVVANGLS